MSSVHPSPPKAKLCWRGNPTNVAVGELETGISHRPIVREKNSGVKRLFNSSSSTPIVTVTLTIRSRLRNEIADGHESSPTSFLFFLDRQPWHLIGKRDPRSSQVSRHLRVWCCNARTRSSSSSPFSIVCLSFLGDDATVTGGGDQGKF